MVMEGVASMLGWGAVCNGTRTGRSVVTSGMSQPRKLHRTAGNHVCSEGIYQGQEQPSQNGQQNCHMLCESHGRD